MEHARLIIPRLTSALHKGSCGRIAVVGGSQEYTGAPYLAAMSAMRTGADLAHVFCTREAAPVIKSYSPDLIVHPLLPSTLMCPGWASLDAVEQQLEVASHIKGIAAWLPRVHALVIGPGLGRDEMTSSCVQGLVQSAMQLGLPLVLDADAIHVLLCNPTLLGDYPLCILTPNAVEVTDLSNRLLSFTMSLHQCSMRGYWSSQENIQGCCRMRTSCTVRCC